MKRLESVFGAIALTLAGSTAVLAVVAVGALVVKGPQSLHQNPPPVSPSPAQVETASTDTQPGNAAAAGAVQAAAMPDPAAGQVVFKKCASCHTADKGGASRTGPNLWGVLNRPAAAVEGFKYSDAMLAQNSETWTPAHLDAFLTKPKDAVPGTSMSFPGLSKPADRMNLIAWLATQSDTPADPASLGFEAVAVAVTADAPAEAMTDEPATDEAAAIVYTDPPAPTDDEIAAIAARIVALQAELPAQDYQRARFNPIHFPPMIDTASDGECLTCHQEILDHKVRETSPAGIKSNEALAWYQTLDTYLPQERTGQSEFHWRHYNSSLAQQTMNLSCNFCHRGNDPREESPDLMPLRAAFSTDAAHPEFTLRKMVNPSETCLRCHGAMPDPVNIMGLGGPWPEVRADMEDQSDPDPTVANGCLTCHAEMFRTNRHNVTYLKAAGIENLAQAGSDTCYGCHGGRAWYRISYPYPRHAWPGMDPEVPEWAKDRPTASDPRYARPETQGDAP